MITLACIFFFQAEDGIRDRLVTGVQTCALPIYKLKKPHKLGLRLGTDHRSTSPPATRATAKSNKAPSTLGILLRPPHLSKLVPHPEGIGRSRADNLLPPSQESKQQVHPGRDLATGGAQQALNDERSTQEAKIGRAHV